MGRRLFLRYPEDFCSMNGTQAVCGNVLHFYDAFYMDPCIHLAIEYMDRGRYSRLDGSVRIRC
jgi:hypothetical protein